MKVIMITIVNIIKNDSEYGDYNGNNDSNYSCDDDDLDNNRSYYSDTMKNNNINNGTK